MEAKNTFVQSRMNKDIDERLLPEGEYPHAENVRVFDSGDSHVGAIENDLGNKKLTDFNLTDAVTIGSIADPSNQKIYFFTTSLTKDLVVEYDELNNVTTVLLESSKPNGVLNFNKNYLITGVNKIINENSSKDLLAWTDDYNPPRIINIERAKTYLPDGFIEDDISVIKKPPVFAPTLIPTYSQNLSQNNLENKFLSFAYRYKYLDGGYSAISPYSYYYFTSLPFKVDYYVLENSAMVNQFNSVKIDFNTGDERVIEVELVVKASNSNTVYVIEKFNKAELGWANNVTQNYTFSNSKLYIALPNTELSRAYDNVPRLAKAQDIVGNRLVYANFLENYDIKDKYGQPIMMDYSPSLWSISLAGDDVPVTTSTGGSAGTNNFLNIDFSNIELKKGGLITFHILLKEQTYDDGRFESSIPYALEEDFTNVADLAASQSFIDFVTLTMSNIFMTGYSVNTPPANSIVENPTPFEIVGVTGSVLTISSPFFEYLINNTPPNTISYWGYDTINTSVTYRIESSTSSMKSNRSYEIGMIYSDKEGRCSTVLTSINNTLHIPHINAVNQNKIRVNINHTAPYWADRYRFAIKQNKNRYYEIYANTFYVDGVFRWIKIEGTNKDKVKENDTLIIKSDLNGFVQDLTEVRVLELGTKERNFIDNNVDNNGNAISEQSGMYMKIKTPSGIDINYRDDAFITRTGRAKSRGDDFNMYIGAFSNYDSTTSTWVDIPITQGSQISFDIQNNKYGSNGGHHEFIKSFLVGADYANISDWYDSEMTGILPFTGSWERGFTILNQFKGVVFIPSPLGALYFRVHNVLNGNGQHPSYMDGTINLNKNSGLLIFETQSADVADEIYYESSETFMINDGLHEGNIENQATSSTGTATCELDYYNCFAFGNGAESNSYRGAFNTNWVNIDLRPSLVTVEKYKENRRLADLTYSETYNEGTGINGLNEFNLSRANFKEDLEKKYGSIQKIWSRNTDILICQEDKIGYVMYGKSVLNNVDGTGNVGKIQDVLGQYIPYTGEYGISNNPESFAVNANRVYFTDTKRGVPLRLGGDGIFEINNGMRNYFKKSFRLNSFSKKVGAYDPYSDQYNILPDGDNINPSVIIDCSETVKRGQFTGVMNIEILYGILKGDAGFSYITNGVPIRFTLNWNGNTYTTGFIGDSSYNAQLATLGYPNVTGGGTGSLVFDKTDFSSNSAVVEVFTPFEEAQFTLSGNCAITPEFEVICVVTNDQNDVGKTLDSRYKWEQVGYSSPYKHFYTPFSNTGLTVYDVNNGFEGVGFVPLDGSIIKMESFKDFTASGAMDNLDRFGYLVSDTLYSSSNITTLLQDATFISKSTNVSSNGDILVKGSFTLNRLGKKYLYLIWDYDTPPLAIDDYENCETNNSVIIPVMFNDQGNLTGYNVIIVTQPAHGSLVVNPDNSVTYTHNGDNAQEDSFTYQLWNGYEYSNIATVSLTIAMSCDSGFGVAGGTAGTYTYQVSFGLGVGQCGMSFSTYNVPDQMQIFWNGQEVVNTGMISTGGTVSSPNYVPFMFNKTSPLPSTATVVVTAPQNGTLWDIIGVCPLVSPAQRSANAKAKASSRVIENIEEINSEEL